METNARAEQQRAKIAESREIIESFRGHRIVLAYSGGKDALAVAFLLRDAGIEFFAVCEVSFYLEKALIDVQQTAKRQKFNVTYTNTLDLTWLRAHPEVIFSDVASVRSWSFSVRHQRAVANVAKHINADAVFWGRRTGDNNVPKSVYLAHGRNQVFPVRNWREREIWAYLDARIERPWIYGTEFGRIEGNAPFYTLNRRNAGGVENCWRIVTGLDPRYTPKMLDPPTAADLFTEIPPMNL